MNQQHGGPVQQPSPLPPPPWAILPDTLRRQLSGSPPPHTVMKVGCCFSAFLPTLACHVNWHHLLNGIAGVCELLLQLSLIIELDEWNWHDWSGNTTCGRRIKTFGGNKRSWLAKKYSMYANEGGGITYRRRYCGSGCHACVINYSCVLAASSREMNLAHSLFLSHVISTRKFLLAPR